jgi:4-amino-4-deoxy-L-arabinose transferase-like glycosyltransferase
VAPTDIHSRRLSPALLFALLFAGLVALHLPLLRLPYFWDEAGYYVPAARDLLLTGSFIPHSTPSNAHPPLVMAYLALWWKAAGYAPVVTRLAMLLVAAFSLLGVFRLAQRIANTEVAVASTLCTGLYPVFFTQSSLAQVDLAAAGLIFWGLLAYIEDRRVATVLWFSLAALAKETAVLAPLALLAWEVFCWLLRRKRWTASLTLFPHRGWKSFLLLVPVVPLALWFAYHRFRTGFVFGNPEFFRYNVQSTMHPLRIALAFTTRLWQTFGYMGLYLLTLAALLAMWFPALPERAATDERETEAKDRVLQEKTRARIAPAVQFAFLAVVSVYVLAMSFIGGAVLARYMLPVVPLVIVVWVSTLRRRVALWRWVTAVVALAFVLSLFVNPPYGFSLEDNLAYRDYIEMHQSAEIFLETHYPRAHVLTAWPASGELSQPWLGYVPRPMRVVQIEDFTVEQLLSAAELRPSFEVALVFSTKYEPRHPLLEHWRAWQGIKSRFFGYHRDVPPAAAAQLLGGHLVYTEFHQGQWVGIIEMEQVEEARR